jgi:uncharacterized tellurite resistance protein B-like protein
MRDQLNILINLAASDNNIAEKEAKSIKSIAQANGISAEEIDKMMKKPKPIGNLSNYTEDQKFESLYHMIQLMKSDGKVFKSEVKFCENIAEKLGYKKSVVAELSSRIYGDPTVTSDRRLLMEKAHKFLKKKQG